MRYLLDSTDYNSIQEPNRNRFEVCEIEVYDDFYNIDKDKFIGIKEFVKVTRNTYIKNSDKHSSDEAMHYIKDVTF